MVLEPDIAAVAALLADPTRSAILSALADGSHRPAGELARLAGVRPQTASEHLDKLVRGRLISMHRQGRFRYYGLASPRIAHILETLAEVAMPAATRSTRETVEVRTLRLGRTCYDHLAGRLGVELAEGLCRANVVRPSREEWELGPPGRDWLRERGMPSEPAPGQRRRLAPLCLDWSERRFHIGGWLGATLAVWLFERQWIERGSLPRAVHLTRQGRKGLKDLLGIDGLPL